MQSCSAVAREKTTSPGSTWNFRTGSGLWTSTRPRRAEQCTPFSFDWPSESGSLSKYRGPELERSAAQDSSILTSAITQIAVRSTVQATDTVRPHAIAIAQSCDSRDLQSVSVTFHPCCAIFPTTVTMAGKGECKVPLARSCRSCIGDAPGERMLPGRGSLNTYIPS